MFASRRIVISGNFCKRHDKRHFMTASLMAICCKYNHYSGNYNTATIFRISLMQRKMVLSVFAT